MEEKGRKEGGDRGSVLEVTGMQVEIITSDRERK